MKQYALLKSLAALAAGWLVMSFASRADVVMFRTGEQLRGHGVAEQPAAVRFDAAALGRIEIPRERIERVERDPAVAASVSPTAPTPAPTNADTNRTAHSREFLRFYTDRGIRYELVQPLYVASPLGDGTTVFSENISVRGRLGFRGSFDAAGYSIHDGQQDIDSDAKVRSLHFYTAGEFGVLRTNLFKLDLGLVGGEFYLQDAYLRWPHRSVWW